MNIQESIRTYKRGKVRENLIYKENLNESIEDMEYNGFIIHPLTFSSTQVGDKKFGGFTTYVLTYKGKQLPDEIYKEHPINSLEDAIDLIDLLVAENPGKFTESLEEKVEKHNELNPKLWENNDLKDEVKEKIKEIVDYFVEGLKEDNINIIVKDVILVGSNCNYNYTNASDVDVHIVCDSSALDCDKETTNLLYSAYRSLFDKKYDIDFYDIPVELYIEMDNPNVNSNGIYSLNTGWIEEPQAEKIPDINESEVEKEFSVYEDRYFDLVKEIDDNEDDKENQIKEIEKFIEDIYELRKTSIANEGEFGVGNLVFKEVRNAGYLDDLKELKCELVSDTLSLENLNESKSLEEFYTRNININNTKFELGAEVSLDDEAYAYAYLDDAEIQIVFKFDTRNLELKDCELETREEEWDDPGDYPSNAGGGRLSSYSYEVIDSVQLPCNKDDIEVSYEKYDGTIISEQEVLEQLKVTKEELDSIISELKSNVIDFWNNELTNEYEGKEIDLN